MLETHELHYLEINEVARLLSSRQLSAVELTQQMLQRIERVDPSLKSYALVTPELALAQAQEADRMLGRRQILSQLHGVPIAAKDLCFTEGVRTASGMPIHHDFVPKFDATAVRKLREAGAVLLGKLQLTEGAFADHHPSIAPPVNPWHADHWSGASSSGSGVATAAGLCFASLGSDTGGSIRFPSAANANTGLKPTWGRVSRHGCFELAASLDHIGPMCRSATDAAIMLGAIAGADADDPTALLAPVPDYQGGDARDLRSFRIGFDEAYALSDVEPDVHRAVDEASARDAFIGRADRADALSRRECCGGRLGPALRGRDRGGARRHVSIASRRHTARACRRSSTRVARCQARTTSACCCAAECSRAWCNVHSNRST